MREMDVVGVRAQMPNNEPIVLLREAGGHRMVPIWIGWNEANAIAEALEGLRPPRPLTHDLLIDTLAGLGHRIKEVHITELDGGTFYAVLLVDGVEISARPSDAIALALRCSAPVYCADDVLDTAGFEEEEEAEEEVEKFREFLDHVSADDFEVEEGPDGPGDEGDDPDDDGDADDQRSA
ncbi:bifunctional nuclease domain-containing protein [Raineyella antarctica]